MKTLLRAGCAVLLVLVIWLTYTMQQDLDRFEWMQASDACISAWGESRMTGRSEAERLMVVRKMTEALEFNREAVGQSDREKRLLELLATADVELADGAPPE